MPAATGAPRGPRPRAKWFNLPWLLPIAFVILLVRVAPAKSLRDTAPVQSFIATYPGTDPRADLDGEYLGVVPHLSRRRTDRFITISNGAPP